MGKTVDERLYLNFEDVLIKPMPGEVESRKSVTLTRAFEDGWNPVPVMSANMDTVTGPEMALALARHNWIAVLHKFVSVEEINRLFDTLEKEQLDSRNIFVTRGNNPVDFEKLKERLEAEPRIQSVCIDVANGHRQSVTDFVARIRDTLCKDRRLMVGNIASGEMAARYQAAGVDIIKVGIGPGSACTTRVQTGCGVPQVSAIMEVKEAVGEKALICSDGGCRIPGDIAKAFAAGADFVMLGGMLAAHKESAAKPEKMDGQLLSRFSGMASSASQWHGVAAYAVAEGKTVHIPYRGPVSGTLQAIEGGLRSACTYVGAPDIHTFIQNARLIRTHVQENRLFG